MPLPFVALPIRRYKPPQPFPSPSHQLPLVQEALIVENNGLVRVTMVQLPDEGALRSDGDLGPVDIRTVAPLLGVEIAHAGEAGEEFCVGY